MPAGRFGAGCSGTGEPGVSTRHRRPDRQEDSRNSVAAAVATCAEIKTLRRVRAEPSRRPPRHLPHRWQPVAKKTKKKSSKRRKDSPIEPKEPHPRLTWCGFAKTFKACGACVCRDAQRNRLGRLFNDMTSDDDPDHVLVGALVARSLEAYRYRHLGVHGSKRKPAPLYDVLRDDQGRTVPPDYPQNDVDVDACVKINLHQVTSRR